MVIGTGRIMLFRNNEDYAAFERVMLEAHQRVPLHILAWHLMLWSIRPALARRSCGAVNSCGGRHMTLDASPYRHLEVFHLACTSIQLEVQPPASRRPFEKCVKHTPPHSSGLARGPQPGAPQPRGDFRCQDCQRVVWL